MPNSSPQDKIYLNDPDLFNLAKSVLSPILKSQKILGTRIDATTYQDACDPNYSESNKTVVEKK